jgi:hypothetical protein
VSRLRTQPLDADFSLTEQWQLPPNWKRGRTLEVNGEGRALLNETAGWFDNFELSANVELIGGSSVSFIVRAVDEQNYYLVRLCGPRSDTPNRLRVFLVKDGQPLREQTFSIGANLSDQFIFDMQVVGGQFKFFIDDNSILGGKPVGLAPLGQYTDNTFMAGSFGVAARANDKAKLFQYLVCPGNCPKN